MRWAGFLRHMEPDMVRRILRGLKLDNETVDNGKAMAGAAQAPPGAGKARDPEILKPDDAVPV